MLQFLGIPDDWPDAALELPEAQRTGQSAWLITPRTGDESKT
jgi:hypothetical protein